MIEAIDQLCERGELTKDRIVHEISRNIDRCWQEGKVDTHLHGCEVLMKARGEWVDRSETRNMSQEDVQAIQREAFKSRVSSN